jgi:hypothetical protein
MTEEQRTKKRMIFTKITELVQLSSALGELTEDEQTIFLAETIKLVLVAGSDPVDCRKFSEHCLNYINDKLMEDGDLSVKEHLVENLPININ